MRVIDGAVCRELYQQSHPKVLHLLKQINSEDGEEDSWSLIRFLLDEVIAPDGKSIKGKWRIWRNVARFSAVALHKTRPRFSELAPERLVTALKTSAVVNLISKPGGSRTNWQQLVKGAREELSIWSGKISELSPDIVICGGTFWVLVEVAYLDRSKVRTLRSGMEYSRDPLSGGIFLDMIHPAFYGIKECVMYSWLRESLIELDGPKA